MKTFIVLPFVLAFPSISFASEACENSLGIPTSTGRLISKTCRNSEGHTIRKSIFLDEQKLLEDQSLYGDRAADKTRMHWIYESEPQMKTGCSERLYLIDLAYKPPKVFAFGVKSACNEFHWASWGAKRSVIALKHNVKFIYENGKLIPPVPGEKLWKSIEPPHGPVGMSENSAIPFAEDIPLPPAGEQKNSPLRERAEVHIKGEDMEETGAT